ncbi:serine/threonine protein kinase [Mycobacterium sp. 050134]
MAAAAAALAGTLTAAPASADPPDTGNPSDVNALAASLSKGYDLKNCSPQTITGGELASLQCGQSPDPNGPAQARYLLFGNGTDLAGSFTKSIKEDVLTGCGGTSSSPTTWHQGSAAVAGQVACGTYQNAAEIIWTTEAKNVLSYIRGANGDAAALYEWWKANG